jgi:hypothetical protein
MAEAEAVKASTEEGEDREQVAESYGEQLSLPGNCVVSHSLVEELVETTSKLS